MIFTLISLNEEFEFSQLLLLLLDDKDSIKHAFVATQNSPVISLDHLFFCGYLLLCISISGLLFISAYSNILFIFMIIELIFLSFGLMFLSSSCIWYNINGFLFALVLLTLAALEAAIGLAIVIVYHRLRKTILLSDLVSLFG